MGWFFRMKYKIVDWRDYSWIMNNWIINMFEMIFLIFLFVLIDVVVSLWKLGRGNRNNFFIGYWFYGR